MALGAFGDATGIRLMTEGGRGKGEGELRVLSDSAWTALCAARCAARPAQNPRLHADVGVRQQLVARSGDCLLQQYAGEIQRADAEEGEDPIDRADEPGRSRGPGRNATRIDVA